LLCGLHVALLLLAGVVLLLVSALKFILWNASLDVDKYAYIQTQHAADTAIEHTASCCRSANE
jgi:hypothetical protein